MTVKLKHIQALPPKDRYKFGRWVSRFLERIRNEQKTKGSKRKNSKRTRRNLMAKAICRFQIDKVNCLREWEVQSIQEYDEPVICEWCQQRLKELHLSKEEYQVKQRQKIIDQIEKEKDLDNPQ